MSVQIHLARPLGFLEAKSFFGYEQPSTGATITATVVPCGFDELAAGFTDEALVGQGMTVLARESITDAPQPQILLQVAQPVGTVVYHKWISIGGDSEQCLIATAAYREDYEEVLSDVLRDAVASSYCEVGEAEAVPESGVPQLQFAGTSGNNVIYTRTGRLVVPSPEEPVFVAGYAAAEWHLPPDKRFAPNESGGM